MRIYKIQRIALNLFAASVLAIIVLGTTACSPQSAEQDEAYKSIENNAQTEAQSDAALTAIESEVHVAADGSDEAGSGTQEAYYSDRAKIVSGFRSLIEDAGSRFVPDDTLMELYMDER